MAGNQQFNIIPFLIALLIFLLMQPYFMWNTIVNIDYLKYAFYLVAITQLDFKGKNLSLFVFLFCSIAVVPIAHGSNIFGVLMYSLVAVIPFLKRDTLKETYRSFRNIYVVVVLISLLVWVLVIAGISLPSKIISPLNDLKQYNYIAYPMLAIPLDASQGLSAVAFGGPFDERGVIGTISLILLFIENINLRDWKNIILLVSGILSLSLFFYVGIIAFYLILLYKRGELIRNKKKVILILSIFVVCITTIPPLYDAIGSRLVFDSEKMNFVGNNRSIEELNDYISSIRFSKEYFFGSEDSVIELFAGQASIYMAVLYYGALFILLYFLFFILYARREFGSINSNMVAVLIVILCVLYQRPGFLKVEYLFLFSSCVLLQEKICETLQID